MSIKRFIHGLAAGAAALALMAAPASAADKKIKIGVIYDYTGPLAGGGSELQAQGAKIMIDFINRQGGVESLIEHRASIEGAGSPVPGDLLRLSVGVEDPADLIADLDQALGGKP